MVESRTDTNFYGRLFGPTQVVKPVQLVGLLFRREVKSRTVSSHSEPGSRRSIKFTDLVRGRSRNEYRGGEGGTRTRGLGRRDVVRTVYLVLPVYLED